MEISGLKAGKFNIIMGKPGVGKSYWLANEKRKQIVKLCSDNEFTILLLEKIDNKILQEFIDKND